MTPEELEAIRDRVIRGERWNGETDRRTLLAEVDRLRAERFEWMDRANTAAEACDEAIKRIAELEAEQAAATSLLRRAKFPLVAGLTYDDKLREEINAVTARHRVRTESEER